MLPPQTIKFDASKKREKVIWQQVQIASVRDCWEVIGPTGNPLTSKLGSMLEVLTVQSTNVERVCKAYGVILSKSRNRLKHQSVQMLLLCYDNLRLLEKESSKVNMMHITCHLILWNSKTSIGFFLSSCFIFL